MSPKSTVWLSIITLLVSIATLVIVWQMQQDLAHTEADAFLITDGNPQPASGVIDAGQY